jgi:putative membrane protein
MKIIIHWLLLSAGIWVTAYFVPGIAISGVITALIAGACLGFINLIIKPILKLITLPINLLTLGLFSIVLNGLLFWALSAVVPGVIITTFMAALIGSVIVALINWLGTKILRLD